VTGRRSPTNGTSSASGTRGGTGVGAGGVSPEGGGGTLSRSTTGGTAGETGGACGMRGSGDGIVRVSGRS
jgi:hypothetical protein